MPYPNYTASVIVIPQTSGSAVGGQYPFVERQISGSNLILVTDGNGVLTGSTSIPIGSFTSLTVTSLTASIISASSNIIAGPITASNISASGYISASTLVGPHTGSTFGTSSWSLNTLSSSISTTASFANTASSLVITNNYQINNLTASTISASTLIGSHTGSTFGTASWANSASFVSPNGNAYVLGGNSFGQNAMLGLNDNFRLDIETSGSTLISLTSSTVGIGTTQPDLNSRFSIANRFKVDGTIGAIKLGGSTNSFGNAYIDFSNALNLGSSTDVVGITGEPRNTGSGNVFGIQLVPGTSISASNITSVRGASFGIRNLGSASVILSGSVYYARSPILSSGSITNAYGLYIEQQKNSSNVSNGYGIYQSDAADRNFFAGHIGIGTTNAINELDVVGNISASVITASLFFGTSSWATNAVTASKILGGTTDYVAKWSSSNTLTSSIIRDDGITIGINRAPVTNSLVATDITFTENSDGEFYNILARSIFSGTGSGIRQSFRSNPLINNDGTLSSFSDFLAYPVKNTTGSLTTLRQYYAGGTMSSGSIGTRIAFYAADFSKTTTSASVVNDIGLSVSDLSGSNSFGVRTELSLAPSKWNIYANGTAPNYFAGNVGIGITNPVNKLDVVGNISASSITASLLFGTSSWAINALTASSLVRTNNYFINSLSASGNVTASSLYTVNGITSSVGGILFTNLAAERFITVNTAGQNAWLFHTGSASDSLILTSSGQVEIGNTQNATTTENGALAVNGGVSVVQDVFVGGKITGTNISASSTLSASSGWFNSLFVNSLTASISGSITTANSSSIAANDSSATIHYITFVDGTGARPLYIDQNSLTFLPSTNTLSSSGPIIGSQFTSSGNIAVNGGSINTTATTFNLVPSNVTTLNIGASTTTSSLAGILDVTNTTLATLNGEGAISTDGGVYVGRNLIVSGSTTLYGDLTIYGTGSIVNISSSTVIIGDNRIQLNTWNSSGTPQRYGGLDIVDSGSTVNVTSSLLWDSLNNYWLLQTNSSGSAPIPTSSAIILQGPTSSFGSEYLLTVNNFLKVQTTTGNLITSSLSEVGNVLQYAGTISASAISGSNFFVGTTIIAATGSFTNLTVVTGSAPGTGSQVPSSPSVGGLPGQIEVDNNFIYVYTNNMWKRVPLSAWSL